MSKAQEIDNKNIYNPNLQDPFESCKRTFMQARTLYDIISNAINNFDLENTTQEQIYDFSCVISSQLGLTAELLFKSIYIFETKNIQNIDEIWDYLSKPRPKLDINGNQVYVKDTPNGEVFVSAKVDENGNVLTDSNGNIIYVDEHGNIYSNGQQGKKINVKGHDLDELLNLMSENTKRMIISRILMFPYDGVVHDISLFDSLIERGISFNKIKTDDYMNLNLYFLRRVFENARYGGQKIPERINVEFLFNLATQLMAIANYRINNEYDRSYTREDSNSLATIIKEKMLPQFEDFFKESVNFFNDNNFLLLKRNMNLILDILNSDIYQKYQIYFSPPVFLHGDLENILKIFQSEEFQNYPYLFTSVTLTHMKYEDIQNIINSEEFVKHTEFFTSTTLLKGQQLIDIFKTEEFKRYPDYFRPSIICTQNPKEIIELIRSGAIDNMPEIYSLNNLSRISIKRLTEIANNSTYSSNISNNLDGQVKGTR